MSELPEGFDTEIQKVFGESADDFQKTDGEQWCLVDHFYKAGLVQGEKQGMLKAAERCGNYDKTCAVFTDDSVKAGAYAASLELYNEIRKAAGGGND